MQLLQRYGLLRAGQVLVIEMIKIIAIILIVIMVGLWAVGLLLWDMQLLHIATIFAGFLSAINLINKNRS